MNKKLHRKTGWKKTFSVVKKKKKKRVSFLKRNTHILYNVLFSSYLLNHNITIEFFTYINT